MYGIELLSNSEIVDTLTEEEKQLVVSNMTKVRYSKGERIIKKDGFVTHAIFVSQGYVKIHSENKGKTVIFNIFGPGSFSGLALMIGQEKHFFDITALDDTTICMIDINVMANTIEKNGLFARHLINYMNSSIMYYIQHNIVFLTQSNIHGRLAKALLYLSQNVFLSNDFDLLLSRIELAQFCNISRENVIKVLYEFKSEGLIKLNGKHIHILNSEQLKRLSDIC
jgi:CRP/FNR family transcriptional regulator, polysaccharide utilization system transcription regulator